MKSFLISFSLSISLLFSLAPLSAKQEQLWHNLNTKVREGMSKWNVPGVAVAVVKDGNIVYKKTFGVRSTLSKEPVTEDTLFQVGSISKSFTATLLAMAVEKGLTTWDTPLQSHWPDFVLYDSWVTKNFLVEDLLTQKTGLPTKAGDFQILLNLSADQALYNLRFIKPISSFRSKYAYQNIFYVAAGRLLEKLHKAPYEELLKKHILQPLGMKNTSASFQQYLASDNRCAFHNLQGTQVQHIPDQFPYLKRIDQYKPAGGINSTITDLAKWLQFQMYQQDRTASSLLSKKGLQKVHRPQIYAKNIGKRTSHYALGWVHTHYHPFPYIWHNGETFGISSSIACIPQDNIGIVILTNARGTKLPQALVWEFFDMYYKKKSKNWLEYFHKKAPTKLVTASMPNDISPKLAQYEGTYRSELYGDITVKKKGDILAISVGPNKIFMSLSPFTEHTFGLNWPGVSHNETTVLFDLKKGGKKNTLKVELFFKESGLVFHKVEDYNSQLFGYL